MSHKSKRELLEAIRPRYLKANKKGKERILDELVASTGYHRKYAIRVLKHGAKPKGLKKPGRQKEYQGKVVSALTRIWEICGRICSERLKPFLPEIVTVLEHHRELVLSAAVKAQLLKMSRATIDRCLKPAVSKRNARGSRPPSPAPYSKRPSRSAPSPIGTMPA